MTTMNMHNLVRVLKCERFEDRKKHVKRPDILYPTGRLRVLDCSRALNLDNVGRMIGSCHRECITMSRVEQCRCAVGHAAEEARELSGC